MKLQRQGPHECLLASLAMVINEKIDDLRREVKKQYGCSWTTILKYGPHGYLLELLNQCGMHWTDDMLIWGGSLGCSFDEAPSFSGRGILIVRATSDKRRHAMAYEAGMIFDPNSTIAMTWKQWLAWHPDKYGCVYELERIVPTTEISDKAVQQPTNKQKKEGPP